MQQERGEGCVAAAEEPEERPAGEEVGRGFGKGWLIMHTPVYIGKE